MVLSYSVPPVSKSSSLSIIAAWSSCIDQGKGYEGQSYPWNTQSLEIKLEIKELKYMSKEF